MEEIIKRRTEIYRKGRKSYKKDDNHTIVNEKIQKRMKTFL